MADEHVSDDATFAAPDGTSRGASMPKAPPISELESAGPNGELATYGTRVGGYVLDAILLAIVAIPLFFLFRIAPHLAQHTRGGGRQHVTFNTAASLPIDILGFLYAVILIAAWQGHTVGMKMVKVRCVRASDGAEVGWGRAVGRAAVYAVMVVLFLPGILDLLWPLWDSKNQTLHDKAAGTVVIKV